MGKEGDQGAIRPLANTGTLLGMFAHYRFRGGLGRNAFTHWIVWFGTDMEVWRYCKLRKFRRYMDSCRGFGGEGFRGSRCSRRGTSHLRHLRLQCGFQGRSVKAAGVRGGRETAGLVLSKKGVCSRFCGPRYEPAVGDTT